MGRANISPGLIVYFIEGQRACSLTLVEENNTKA